MKPRQVLEIFTAAQRRTEPKSLVILRAFIAILFFIILICYMFVQIGNFTYINEILLIIYLFLITSNFYLNIEDVRLDTPIFSVVQSHDEETVIPMPSMFMLVLFRLFIYSF
jgi:hypothetical protein